MNQSWHEQTHDKTDTTDWHAQFHWSNEENHRFAIKQNDIHTSSTRMTCEQRIIICVYLQDR